MPPLCYSILWSGNTETHTNHRIFRFVGLLWILPHWQQRERVFLQVYFSQTALSIPISFAINNSFEFIFFVKLELLAINLENIMYS